MHIAYYLSKTIKERTKHVDLNQICEPGGPLSSSELGQYLNVSVADTTQATAVCGNPNCSNPNHYVFFNTGEKRKYVEDVKRHRVLNLLASDQYKNTSVCELARLAGVSHTLVRNVIKKEGIVRATVEGADGRIYTSKRGNTWMRNLFNAIKEQTKAAEPHPIKDKAISLADEISMELKK